MANRTQADILSTLDVLVADGVITTAAYESVSSEHGDYSVEIRICPAMVKKPNSVGASIDPAISKSRKWGPGSDMVVPDERLILEQLNETHDLALNLFCIDRPQLLLLTQDSYQRQDQPLDIHDCTVALSILNRMPDMYIIYNCGQAAGCSRMHKHMQGLKGPPYAFRFFEQPGNRRVPFKYFARRLEAGFGATAGRDLFSAYTDLLNQARASLELQSSELCPHNVVMWADWIIVIPRRRESWNGVSANSAGMLGSLWVAKQEQAEEWLRLGPATVLKELGVPA